MTLAEMTALFKKHDGEFLKFNRITKLHAARPDLNAFIKLDALLPGTADIVSDAEHDQIYLSIEPEKLAAVASEEDIVDLIRSGVMYSEEWDCLSMFV